MKEIIGHAFQWKAASMWRLSGGDGKPKANGGVSRFWVFVPGFGSPTLSPLLPTHGHGPQGKGLAEGWLVWIEFRLRLELAAGRTQQGRFFVVVSGSFLKRDQKDHLQCAAAGPALWTEQPVK